MLPARQGRSIYLACVQLLSQVCGLGLDPSPPRGTGAGVVVQATTLPDGHEILALQQAESRLSLPRCPQWPDRLPSPRKSQAWAQSDRKVGSGHQCDRLPYALKRRQRTCRNLPSACWPVTVQTQRIRLINAEQLRRQLPIAPKLRRLLHCSHTSFTQRCPVVPAKAGTSYPCPRRR